MTETHPASETRRDIHVIETAVGAVVAYVEYKQRGTGFGVRELGVLPGHSWRAVALFLTQVLKAKADELNKKRPKPIDNVSFNMGYDHPVYEALGKQLEKQIPAYAWYIRVPDLPGFLQHITPVLERRLANSVMAGHTGNLRLNFYQSQLQLAWAQGKLVEIAPYEMSHYFDYGAAFPDLTFLQLLFGHRTADELAAARADCDIENEATAVILLNILFPKQHSSVVGLG
jgi:hypothetical protein